MPEPGSRQRGSGAGTRLPATATPDLTSWFWWERRHISPAWEAIHGAQPGMAQSAAALFDVTTGTYTAQRTPYNPFCTGHSHLP